MIDKNDTVVVNKKRLEKLLNYVEGIDVYTVIGCRGCPVLDACDNYQSCQDALYRYLKGEVIKQMDDTRRFRVGDMVLARLRGNKYVGQVIHVDVNDNYSPYLCSFGKNKTEASNWMLSFRDVDEYGVEHLPYSVVRIHYAEFVQWLPESRLEPDNQE